MVIIDQSCLWFIPCTFGWTGKKCQNQDRLVQLTYLFVVLSEKSSVQMDILKPKDSNTTTAVQLSFICSAYSHSEYQTGIFVQLLSLNIGTADTLSEYSQLHVVSTSQLLIGLHVHSSEMDACLSINPAINYDLKF